MNEWCIIQTALRGRMSVLSPWKTLVPGNYQMTHQLLIKPLVTAHRLFIIRDLIERRTLGLSWSTWTLCTTTDLLLGDHCLVDEVLQLLIGKVDAQLLKAVHSKVLREDTGAMTSRPTPKAIALLFSSFQISVHTEHQPQTRRCPQCPRCCPSLWDWASHWSAPAASQTAPNIRLWQWHLCKRYHNEGSPPTSRSLHSHQVYYLACETLWRSFYKAWWMDRSLSARFILLWRTFLLFAHQATPTFEDIFSPRFYGTLHRQRAVDPVIGRLLRMTKANQLAHVQKYGWWQVHERLLTVTLWVMTVCSASEGICNKQPTLLASASLKIRATSNDSLWSENTSWCMISESDQSNSHSLSLSYAHAPHMSWSTCCQAAG